MAEERKLRVYCETSFWSFLNGRPTPLQHIAIKQAATLQWWQEIAPRCGTGAPIAACAQVSPETLI